MKLKPYHFYQATCEGEGLEKVRMAYIKTFHGKRGYPNEIIYTIELCEEDYTFVKAFNINDKFFDENKTTHIGKRITIHIGEDLGYDGY